MRVSGQFIRFCAVGATGTGVQYGTFYALGLAGFPGWLGLGLSFAAGATSNYVWNQLWTFKGPLSAKRLVKFYASTFSGAAAQYAVYIPATAILHLAWWFALGLAILVGVLPHFAVSKYWALKAKATGHGD